MNTNPHVGPNGEPAGRPIVTRGPVGSIMTDDELRALLASHGFPDVEAWLAIVKRESGGDPGVMVDTRGMSDAELHAYWGAPFAGKRLLPELSVGLFMVNTLANKKYTPDELRDPNTSAGYAFLLSNGGVNFAPWGGRPKV